MNGTDRRNLLLISLGWLAIIVLISPARDYSVIDDWVYADQVQQMLAGHGYVVHQWSQANPPVLIVLGAAACYLFGYSFTTMGLVCWLAGGIGGLCFYLLLREVELAPRTALLTTALLMLNPLYVHLAYSFMTDLPFLALMLGSSLLTVKGLKRLAVTQAGVDGWLLSGSLLAALAALTRIYGVVLVVAVLIYLFLARRLTIASILATAVLPVSLVGSFYLYLAGQPPPLVEQWIELRRNAIFPDFSDRLLYALIRALSTLPMLGVLIPLLVPVRRRGYTLLVLAIGLLIVWRKGDDGNVVWGTAEVLTPSGYFLDAYVSEPIFSFAFWLALSVVGVLFAALLLTVAGERAGGWLRQQRDWRNRTQPQPAVFLYLSLGLIALLTYSFGFIMTDRYLLPLLPALLLLAGQQGAWAGWRGRVGLATLVLLAGFSLLLQVDYNAHATTRWQAGQQLVASGVDAAKVDAGYEWEGYYLFNRSLPLVAPAQAQGRALFPPRYILDPQYVVADQPVRGYREIGSRPYFSILGGFSERRVRVYQRE